MATINGLTAERMLEIEGASVVGGEVVDDNLILNKHDGTTINAGPVTGPEGPPGPPGPASVGAIPGEVKLWPNTVLPEEGTYGKWVWADGAYYPIATYPLAAAHIGSQWRTFDGASDPGVPNFRVPDLRGLVAAGLDQMPGGSRANRMTRAAAITMATKSGKETHARAITEIAAHSHRADGAGGSGGATVNTQPTFTGTPVPNHVHAPLDNTKNFAVSIGSTDNLGSGGSSRQLVNTYNVTTEPAGAHTPAGTVSSHGHGINPAGGGGAHENIQPTVFVPYIVFLGG